MIVPRCVLHTFEKLLWGSDKVIEDIQMDFTLSHNFARCKEAYTKSYQVTSHNNECNSVNLDAAHNGPNVKSCATRTAGAT